MRAALSSLLLLIAACEHSSPFTFVPGTQGPWGGGLPRRLTFSAGDDRNASVTGGLIVFSRLEASALATRERCLALLPVDGGTLRGEDCPRLPTTLADTFLDTWTEPALSPDGHWVAFSWQQGSLVSVLGFYRTRLVVAPTAHADDTTRFAWYIDYAATAGTVTGILKPEWLDADRIRFLGAYEFFFKVKGGGQERYTDTTFVPLALLELDLRTGLVALVPGGDSATAWARAPDGGAWIVKAGDPARLLHLAAGIDVSTTVGVFTDSVGHAGRGARRHDDRVARPRHRRGRGQSDIANAGPTAQRRGGHAPLRRGDRARLVAVRVAGESLAVRAALSLS